MTRARPLRFLAVVLGLWIGARAVMLALPGAPRPSSPTTVANTTPIRPDPDLPSLPTAQQATALEPLAFCCLIRDARYKGILVHSVARAEAAIGRLGPFPIVRPTPARPVEPFLTLPPVEQAARSILAPAGAPAPTPRSTPRWSGSAWLLVRGRGQAALAPGGTLGGSQAGGRLLYRLDGGFSLSGRAYAPLRQTAGSEVAAGIDWRPSPRVPVHILAERRQDVGDAGRSAFALIVHGGASGRLAGGLRGEVYVQAGVVGTQSRNFFVEGSARASMPAGRFEVGGSAWGAAQPGAARLDAGPSASYRLPVRDANIRIQADWRFRIAGDAEPGSGPALTIAADF